ncbi:MAG: YciI family protein [Cyclobacteriaceae bacterium]
MSEYLVLINATNESNISPADEDRCMSDYGLWAQALGEKHILGKRLDISQGTLLKSKQIPLTDGPFAEGKELVVGIILLAANSLKEASEIANSCPLGDYFDLLVKEVKE